MAPDAVAALGELLAKSGVGVTVLPATDLFLLGRGADRLVPRGLAPAARLQAHGVLVTIASNNILNPFTPFGDASLNRMASLYANVAQLASDEELNRAFAMVSTDAARLLGRDQRLAPDADADIVLIDAASGADAVRSIAPVLAGWKRGRKTFHRERPALFSETQSV
jgi:cytosine/creatinine deaminase